MRRYVKLLGCVFVGLAAAVGAFAAVAGEPDNAGAAGGEGRILDALKRSFVTATALATKDSSCPQQFRSIWELLGVDSRGAYTYAVRAYRHSEKKEYEAALEDCNRALLLDPDYEYALSFRADLFLRLKRPDEALRDFDRLSKRYAGPCLDIFGGKASAYLLKGDYASAAEYIKKAIALNPDDAGKDYVAWPGEELSKEALEHGERQLRRAMKDRPAMAEHIDESSPVWKWAARAFAGEGLPDTVDWSGESASSGTAEHRPMSRKYRGIVRVGTADNQNPDGVPFTGDQLWAMLIFELHNLRQSVVGSQYLAIQAMREDISEEDFVRLHCEFEGRASQQQRAFFLHVYLPYAAEKKLEVDPEYWYLDHLWCPMSKVFEGYTDKDSYPWVPYSSYYRNLTDPEQRRAPTSASDLQDGRIRKSSRHLIRGEYLQALRQCESVLREDEEHVLARYFRAIIRFSQRDYERTIADCDRLLKDDPDMEFAREFRGIALVEMGRTKEGVAELKRVHDQSPKWAGPNASYGYGLAHQGRLKEAMEHCERAVAANPKMGHAYYCRAFVRFKQGDYSGAIEDCTKSVELERFEYLTFELRAKAYEKAGETEKAEADRKKADQLVADRLPEEQTAAEKKGGILGALGRSFYMAAKPFSRRRTGETPVVKLTRKIEVYPGDAELYVERAREYLSEEQYETALADAKEALRLDSDNRVAFALRHRLLLRLGRDEEALAEYDRLIDEGCRRPEVFGYRASVHLQNNRYDAAAADLKKAIALNPDDAGKDYVAWLKEDLSEEDLAHGAKQVRRMLEDRPMMAQDVDESSPVWKWTVRAFAGEGSEEPIEWSPGFLVAAEEKFLPVTLGTGGLIPTALRETKGTRGRKRAGDRSWATVLLELHHRRRFSTTCRYLMVRAVQGRMQKEEFVKRLWECDAKASQELRAFLLRVYLPYAREKRLEIDPTAWRVDQFWGPLNRTFAGYEHGREYPSAQYKRYYDYFTQPIDEQTAESESESVDWRLRKCLRHIMRDECEEALRESDAILRLDEKNADARYYRAAVHALQRNYNRAIGECDLALANDPDNPSARELRGVCLVDAGRIEEGARELRELVRQSHKWPGPNASYGYALAHQRKLDEALKYCNKAVSLYPDLDQPRYCRAYVWFRKGEYEKAIQDCTKAIDSCPFLDLAFELRAKAHEKLGETEKAETDRQKARELLEKRLGK